MRIKSLRSKVFLLVGTTLSIVALATILLTQRDVRQTVIAGEELAVRNVLTLLARDSEARWGGLLSDKIVTVRRSRRHLIQQGDTVQSVLTMYQLQVEQGELSKTQAQAMAIGWINALSVDQSRYSYVFSRKLHVIASGNPSMLGMDLSALQDIKGRPLAESSYQEASTSGQSFAIYRWSARGSANAPELRYAYFTYFEPWDWVVAISDNATEVTEQFQRRRAEMETALSETLASLRFAQSGFFFIVKDQQQLLPDLEPEQMRLLHAPDRSQGKTLLDLLADGPRDDQISTRMFHSAAFKSAWQISTVHFKPLKWTIVAAVPADDLSHAANTLRTRLLLLFLAVLASSLAVAWSLSARIIRPLQQLSDYARALPDQDLGLPASTPAHIAGLPERQPDEVGRLAATFMYMDQQLREKIAHLLQETTRRERLQSELNIARSIQMGLLPPPPDAELLRRIDLQAFMHPAREVGGDLYDHFLLPDGRLCLAIGDVSDKGVPAALFMAFTATLIRAWAEHETDPARLVARINDRLAQNNPRMMFTTLVLALLDLDSGELRWVNAGHPPLLAIAADGTVRTLAGRSGPACGIQDGLAFECFTTRLAPGECLLGYTDGITEALAPDGTLYGEARLTTLLHTQGARSAADVVAAVLADVRAFAQDTEQADDMTALLARRYPPRPADVAHQADAQPAGMPAAGPGPHEDLPPC